MKTRKSVQLLLGGIGGALVFLGIGGAAFTAASPLRPAVPLWFQPVMLLVGYLFLRYPTGLGAKLLRALFLPSLSLRVRDGAVQLASPDSDEWLPVAGNEVAIYVSDQLRLPRAVGGREWLSLARPFGRVWEGEDEVPDYWYSVRRGRMVLLLYHLLERPNVLLLLNRGRPSGTPPVLLPRSEGSASTPTGQGDVIAIAARLSDQDSLADAFPGLAVLKAPDADEVRILEPTAIELRRAIVRTFVHVVLIGGAVASFALARSV